MLSDSEKSELAIRQLEQAKEMDQEEGHYAADCVLCELLRSLGFGSVVDVYEQIGKWYA